ncbi:MAG TPA: 3-hydroxyacyl-CoA dehydrogenase family protein [Actinophytocola sp.]|uniref:3-hydroxyacyl-CoA dehydrogenase family protein n=1 Tax=Actinophytocola sp. TaxID=1872138 RepID=UPI002DB7B28F|nr:3-hydroxyacyl-CoA dehydrogenase family protein [Actinophytocola sp.]HEU5474647.1 3-hydroxyacyl-CoA dehydrogenase family protein [Actinophytocola sp.]
MEFTTVGVIGAGVMGVGVAQNLAQTGHRVVLLDISDEVLDNARRELRDGLRAYTLFNRDAAVDPAAVFDRIDFSTDYELLAKADFVVENVTEDWDIKEAVYRRIDRIVRPEVVFAVNTSAISITRVGAVTDRPDRVVGMHFMNPVPMKPMVEVIQGYHTSAETIDTARRFLAGMGKDCIVVEDMPGFVSNRVLMLTINEAVFLVQDGVAAPADVDRIFKTCFGHKMGPLETADLIGLDTILKSVEVLYDSYNDDKYRPAPLLKKMVAAGVLGRKSGAGFHRYR